MSAVALAAEVSAPVSRYPLQVLGKEIVVETPLVGRHQLRNIALAIAAAETLARKIMVNAPLAVKFAKEAVLKAFETSLHDGLDFERKCFYLLFGSEDQKEGMRAFLEKRKPVFKGK